MFSDLSEHAELLISTRRFSLCTLRAVKHQAVFCCRSSERRGAALVPGVTNVCFLLLTHQQTQSLYIHKELMKRTLGTPTCAIEAREYVVSLSMVWSAHTVATQSLTPLTTPAPVCCGNVLCQRAKENLVGGKWQLMVWCAGKIMSASLGNAEIGTIKVAGPVKFKVLQTGSAHLL